MGFEKLGLSPASINQIALAGFSEPYPIQQQAIPVILAGKDVLGIAKTGSGKTASYVLPILAKYENTEKKTGRQIDVLVLVPTRELAVQVADVFKYFSSSFPNKPKVTAVFGGVSINPQMKGMAGTRILVATPGRLLDLIRSNALQLSTVSTLVIDEADKLLNLGFKEEMDEILKLLPVKRQNVLFSATLDTSVDALQALVLHNAQRIEIQEDSSEEVNIEQVAYLITDERRGPFLRYVLKEEDPAQVLIFVSAVRTADNLVVKLKKNGVEATALHSGKSQGSRTDTLTKFKNGKLKVLVATDLAARGIDVENLPLVINYELPRSPKDYIHRIGRTGRAGKVGKAITLLTIDEEPHFYVIQKKMGKRVKLFPTDAIDLHKI